MAILSPPLLLPLPPPFSSTPERHRFAFFKLPSNSTNGALLGGQLSKRHRLVFAKASSSVHATREELDTVNIAEDVTQVGISSGAAAAAAISLARRSENTGKLIEVGFYLLVTFVILFSPFMIIYTIGLAVLGTINVISLRHEQVVVKAADRFVAKALYLALDGPKCCFNYKQLVE